MAPAPVRCVELCWRFAQRRAAHLPHAAATVLAAFMPSVPLAALAGWFGFSKKKEAASFLRECGAVVVQGRLEIKESRVAAVEAAAAAAAAAANG